MKICCGTDIIEISRVKDSIDGIGDVFLKKIFTEKEIAYCESHGKQKYQHYAARFAAKEAVFKAVSEMLSNKYELTWTDYEVINASDGRPYIKLPEKYLQYIENIDVSLSHCKEYATANVTILFK